MPMLQRRRCRTLVVVGHKRQEFRGANLVAAQCVDKHTWLIAVARHTQASHDLFE